MFGQVGQHRGTQAQKSRLHGGFQAAVKKLGDNVLQLLPDVDGDDRRRCFMSTQTVIIACAGYRSEEHTSELQSRGHLVCRLLLEKKKQNTYNSSLQRAI